MDEVGRTVAETDKVIDKQFKKLMREEKNRGLSDMEAMNSVCLKLGYKTEYANHLLKQHKESEIQKRYEYSNRCGLKLESLSRAFGSQNERLADLKETNMYGLQMASVDQFLSGALSTATSTRDQSLPKKLNEDVTPSMIKQYIDKLKSRGELASQPEANKQQAQQQKLELSKK